MRVRREKYDRLIADPQRAPFPVGVRAHGHRWPRSRGRYPDLAAGTETGRHGRRHRPGDLRPQHRQAVLRHAARGRCRAAGDAVARPRRRGVAGGVEGRRRPRRPGVRARRGHLVQARRAVGAGRRLAHHRQGAAAVAGGPQAAVGGDPGPAALCRPDRAPGCPPNGLHPGRRSLRSLRETLHDAGYVEVETPVLQVSARRGGRPSLPHASERVRPRYVAAYCHRVVSEAVHRRRDREGLRDRPGISQ